VLARVREGTGSPSTMIFTGMSACSGTHRTVARGQYRSASLVVPDTSSVVGFSDDMWF
jgi:hypothetical protein